MNPEVLLEALGGFGELNLAFLSFLCSSSGVLELGTSLRW